jgi:excinuclease ABC subunit A
VKHPVVKSIKSTNCSGRTKRDMHISPADQDFITIKGAREHNLKNIDLKLPRHNLIVITGLSGSGKSSLAFDTLYAEGQRRYVESLSAYARQFLGIMEKPDVDYIEGLSPAISIEQRTLSKNPRSTVGTITEIYDYLRLLYARIGIAHCPQCGKMIASQTVEQIVDHIMLLPEKTRIVILAPVVRGRKGEYRQVFEKIRREGYVRVRVDGETRTLDDLPALDKNRKHNIEVVVDRLILTKKISSRLADSIQTAIHLAKGVVIIQVPGEGDRIYSEQLACVDCGISIEELSPRMFSFNSPFGACNACGGLGSRMEIDPELVVPDPSRSIMGGAIVPWGNMEGKWRAHLLDALVNHYGFDPHTPFDRLDEKIQKVILYGSEDEIRFNWSFKDGKISWAGLQRFEGVVNNLSRRYVQTSSQSIRTWIEGFMSFRRCHECNGGRLRRESLSVKVGGKSIHDLTVLSVKDAINFFDALALTRRDYEIARQITKEISARLRFLSDVGLDYLTLDRASATLAGGEGQRIRLATQIGSSLVGVLYILDEPSIGLHQRDNRRLLNTLKRLRDLGNTVIVVEHDKETILSADHVVDLGPGAGRLGGKIVVSGPPEMVANSHASLTGRYISGKKTIPVPSRRKRGKGKYLTVVGAREHNLKNIDVSFPLGTFICVTGVSGSGKSTLINDILFRHLAHHFYRSIRTPGKHTRIEGLEYIDKVINIDQSPIGRTPRSNPATYTGVFTPLRNLFAQTPAARMRGYRPGRFSFNVKGGRCEACAGEGIKKIEMHFLPDVYVPCEVCKGKRYNRETLEVHYRGKTIAEVLAMTVDEALTFFENIPAACRILSTISDVGLGYICLGQPATTLSGGEAQRVKLSTELAKKSTGNTFYILDEPTTGLHFEDVKILLRVLNRLVDRGNTVVVIEHNMDVIKTADHIIDLGPEGGDRGGRVVAQGSPEEIIEVDESFTGQFLSRELRGERIIKVSN